MQKAGGGPDVVELERELRALPVHEMTILQLEQRVVEVCAERNVTLIRGSSRTLEEGGIVTRKRALVLTCENSGFNRENECYRWTCSSEL